MTSRVCRCCGEQMSENPSAFSRNPNVCAACEDQSGGFQEPTVNASADCLPGSLAIDEESAEMQNAA